MGLPGEKQFLPVAAVLAVGAAAVGVVAGVGAYLYIRFTQHRRPAREKVKPTRVPTGEQSS